VSDPVIKATCLLSNDQCDDILHAHFQEEAAPQEGEALKRLYWYRNMIRRAYNSGYTKGYSEGYETGYADGNADGRGRV
jgi:flagellar biosynthesis/type III secretory pathway protein FliH